MHPRLDHEPSPPPSEWYLEGNPDINPVHPIFEHQARRHPRLFTGLVVFLSPCCHVTSISCRRVTRLSHRSNPNRFLAVLRDRTTQQGWRFRGLENKQTRGLKPLLRNISTNYRSTSLHRRAHRLSTYTHFKSRRQSSRNFSKAVLFSPR